MTTTAKPIVKIIDHQTYLDQTVLNIYHYKFNDDPDPFSLSELASKFILEIIDEIVVYQSDQLTHVGLTLTEVNTGVAVLDVTHSIPGESPGILPAPSFICANYKLDRVDGDTRPGRKSIAGLDETEYEENELTAGGVTAWANLEADFPKVLTTDSGDWQPIILGKQDPIIPAQYKINKFVTAGLNTDIRTQVSRRKN